MANVLMIGLDGATFALLKPLMADGGLSRGDLEPIARYALAALGITEVPRYWLEITAVKPG